MSTPYVEPFDRPIGERECDETTCTKLATHLDPEGYAWCEDHRA